MNGVPEVKSVEEFNHQTFGRLRSVIYDNEVWFVAADVRQALRIEKEYPPNTIRLNIGFHGGNVTCFKGRDMIEFVGNCFKPNAKEFISWIDSLPISETATLKRQRSRITEAKEGHSMSSRAKIIPNFTEHYNRLISKKVTKSALCKELKISYPTLNKLVAIHQKNLASADIMVFENPAFGQLRSINKNDELWFVALDVCKALGIANSRDALSRIDADEKSVVLTDTPGGKQEMQAVNEPGLYSLVLGSRKPEAKVFKRWVTHEVIPSVRKHGGYLLPEKVEEILLSPDTLIQLATNLKNEQEKRKALEAQTKNLVGQMTRITMEMSRLLS